MACTDRFSFRAIDGLSRPDASNAKSCASSAGVHGRPVGRGPSFIWLSHLQPPALQADAAITASVPSIVQPRDRRQLARDPAADVSTPVPPMSLTRQRSRGQRWFGVLCALPLEFGDSRRVAETDSRA